MIFKCKICGGSLDAKIGERTAVCEYCGVEQTIPSFIDIKAEEIYNRANAYLSHNEFDKAENLYNQILVDNKSDADAYWNILMCRYGVTYVEDPASGKYMPTCNRTLYAPIFNDENYINAIEYADDAQRALFEKNAKIIDDIQKGILAVSKKEKPFDIFISYKETDKNGARTKESIAAQELYEKLTQEGYKVFFSRITLEDKAGTEYEPYIYAALASSKVMLTVSSSKENIESTWVKNEWSRFLSFMGKDSGKTLIPLYFDMDKSDLPDDFAHMPSYDMKIDGFEQDLIRGIKKLIPLPVMLLEKRKKRNKIIKRIGIAVATCAVIGTICAIPWFMKLPQYNAAMQLYYDKNYPEATWAFADLGNYRNSKEMEGKCELSWRKSLAEVYSSHGECFITPNGTVESMEFIDTTAINDFDINSHGAAVSITASHFENPPYILCEDGYVQNSKDNNRMADDTEFHNIVKISDQFNSTNVALRADGKMLFGTLEDPERYSDMWLKELEDWENIVDFDYTWFGNECAETATVVGVKKDGTLRAVVTAKDEVNDKVIDEFSNIKDIISRFYDVKKIRVFADDDTLSIIALTKHNTMMVYLEKEFHEYPVEKAVDCVRRMEYQNGVILQYPLYLKANGELVDLTTNHSLVKDIVKLDWWYAIGRNGSLYVLNDLNSTKNIKVCVYDEWLERIE